MKSWGTFPSSQHFSRVEGCAGVLGWVLGRMTSNQLLTWTCTNQTTSWLMHNWSIFYAWMSHGQTWTHKTHHSPNLGEATTFPFIVFSVPGHEANTQMSFCLGTLKLESRNSQNWDSFNFRGP
jgi:hypothetical protein